MRWIILGSFLILATLCAWGLIKEITPEPNQSRYETWEWLSTSSDSQSWFNPVVRKTIPLRESTLERYAVAFVLISTLLPVGVIALTLSTVHALSPRRVFMPVYARSTNPATGNTSTSRRVRRSVTSRLSLLALGACIGVAIILLGTLALALGDQYLPDTLLLGVTAAIVTLIPALFMKRVRKGSCRSCGYSLLGASPASRGICPECGCDQHAV